MPAHDHHTLIGELNKPRRTSSVNVMSINLGNAMAHRIWRGRNPAERAMRKTSFGTLRQFSEFLGSNEMPELMRPKGDNAKRAHCFRRSSCQKWYSVASMDSDQIMLIYPSSHAALESAAALETNGHSLKPDRQIFHAKNRAIAARIGIRNNPFECLI
jgi:hypothetical protein